MSRSRSSYSRSSVRALAATLAVAVFCAGGCVQRRMTVRTNVPGAQVYVDNYEIGRTPVSTDFIYYGQRDIRLVKDGYETLKVKQSVNAPWYQYPGIDFLVENVWPFEIRDERNFNYQMQPQYLVPTETILARAEELRTANAAPEGVAPVIAQPLEAQPPFAQPGMTQPPTMQPGYAVPPAGAFPTTGTVPPQGAPFQGAPMQGAPQLPPGYSAQPSR